MTTNHTNNGIPVGIGYDSRDRARSLMELSSVNVSVVSATTYQGLPNTGLSALSGGFSDICDTVPTLGQTLTWNGAQWCPSTVVAGGGGGGGGGVSSFSSLSEVYTDPPYEPNFMAYFSATNQIGVNSVSTVVTTAGGFSIEPNVSYVPTLVNATLSSNVSTNTTNINTNSTNLTTIQTGTFLTTSTNSFLSNELVLTSTPTVSWVFTSNSASASVVEGGLTHNSLAGLGDGDPHPQYTEVAETTYVSSVVSSVETSTINLSSVVASIETSTINLSSAVASIETSTINLSSYISSNESSWDNTGYQVTHSNLDDLSVETFVQGEVIHYTGSNLSGLPVPGDSNVYVLSIQNGNLSWSLSSAP